MAERITRNFKPFQKGKKVSLEAKNLNTGHSTRKLAPKCEGPFMIEAVISPLSYQLKLPDRWKIHPVFHAVLLSPYQENSIHGKNYLLPPPNLIEGEEEYEVEAITAHWRYGNSHKFLVK